MKRILNYRSFFYGIIFLGVLNSMNAFSQELRVAETMSEAETTRILYMVQNNRLSEMETLINEDPRRRKKILEVKDKGGKNLLGVAVKRSYLGMAALLTAFGIEINEKDAKGKTPLLQAVKKDDEAMVAYFLRQGADPNIEDNNGNFPLYVAAKQGSLSLMEILLEKGANLGKVKKGETVLHVAARYGQARVFPFLAPYPLCPALNSPNEGGATPLLLAIYKGEEPVVDVLLDLGVDPNQTSSDGISALQVAAYVNNPSIMKKLIRKGADLQYRSPEALGGSKFLNYLGRGRLSREECLRMALSIYEPLAEEGSIAAMYQAGRIYELIGQGEETDYKAFTWYRCVLDHNSTHANANFKMGVLYEQGRGRLEKDIRAAFYYYDRACKAGHKIAEAKIRIRDLAGGNGAYRDIAALRREIQEKYIASKRRIEEELRKDYNIPGFDLREDYQNALQVLERIKAAHENDPVRVNYGLISCDPHQGEYNVDFEGEIEDEKITSRALTNIKNVLMREISNHPAFLGRFRSSLTRVMGVVKRSDACLKKKFIGILERYIKKSLEEGKNEQEAMGVFALKLVQNEERCGDGLSTYLDEELTNLLQNTSEGRTLGGRLSQVLQLYKQEFMEKHKNPFEEAVEERTEALVLLRQRMRLSLGLIGNFHKPLYPALGFGQEARYTPSHVMERFLEGGEITFRSNLRGEHTKRFQPLTPALIIELFMEDYRKGNILRNEYFREYIEQNQELKEIHDNAVTMMEDHPYFNLTGSDGIHYLTAEFMKRIAIDHGFLISRE